MSVDVFRMMGESIFDNIVGGSVSEADAKRAMELLTRCSAPAEFASRFAASARFAIAAPSQPGYCYLQGFPRQQWLEVADELGPDPKFQSVLGALRDRSLSEVGIRVVAAEGKLHVCGEGEGVLYADYESEIRERMLAFPTGAPVEGGQEDVGRFMSVGVSDLGSFACVAEFVADSLDVGKVPVISLVSHPVDLSVLSYGPDTSAVENEAGSSASLLEPVISISDPRSYAEFYGWYFVRDRGFEEADVRSDTELYMRVTAARLIEALRLAGFGPHDYDLRVSTTDQDHVQVGKRHAAQQPDYLLGLDVGSYEHYVRAISGIEQEMRESFEPRGPTLRSERVRACEAYLRQFGELQVKQLEVTHSVMHAFVGGPFTHLASLMRKGVRLSSLTAMIGCVDPCLVTVGELSNVQVHPDAAQYVLVNSAEVLTCVFAGALVGMPSLRVDRVGLSSLWPLYRRWLSLDYEMSALDWGAYAVTRDFSHQATPKELTFFRGRARLGVGGYPCRVLEPSVCRGVARFYGDFAACGGFSVLGRSASFRIQDTRQISVASEQVIVGRPLSGHRFGGYGVPLGLGAHYQVAYHSRVWDVSREVFVRVLRDRCASFGLAKFQLVIEMKGGFVESGFLDFTGDEGARDVLKLVARS